MSLNYIITIIHGWQRVVNGSLQIIMTVQTADAMAT